MFYFTRKAVKQLQEKLMTLEDQVAELVTGQAALTTAITALTTAVSAIPTAPVRLPLILRRFWTLLPQLLLSFNRLLHRLLNPHRLQQHNVKRG